MLVLLDIIERKLLWGQLKKAFEQLIVSSILKTLSSVTLAPRARGQSRALPPAGANAMNCIFFIYTFISSNRGEKGRENSTSKADMNSPSQSLPVSQSKPSRLQSFAVRP
jgi:hypothetical protein